jgi:hypothetical protein
MATAPKADLSVPITGILSEVTAPLDFGVSLIVSIVGALFSGLFGGPDTNALAKAVDDLRNAVAQGFDEATRFAWAIANGMGALLQAFATAWDNFFDALWQDVKAIWKAVWCALATVLPKIIQIIKNVRTFLDTIYQKYLRPILNYLQILRKYLYILRLLHVPFAAKLDRVVGQIQSAIIGPFLWVFRTLNQYANWVNVILAADLTIQRAVFVRTMFKYQSDWVSMWWTGQQQVAAAPGGPPIVPAPVAPTNAQVTADFTTYVGADSGPYADTANQTVAAFAAIMAS